MLLSRFDRVKYPWMRKLTRKQMGYFWQPEEVELVKDSKDFKLLDAHERHIFVSNLKRQILLDSVQGSAPSEAFGSICSLPEFRNFLKCWEFFEENIHAWSYQYVLENLYASTSEVYDEIDTVPEIKNCRTDIQFYYDDLIAYNKLVDSQCYSSREHKKKIWLALHAVNFLEGIRFYVSFACSWAFAELHKMEGNAKIIKMIARDENIHLAFTQQLIRALPKDDSDYASIADECRGEVERLAKSVSDQEKDWAKYLFKDGSMLGLNSEMLSNFVDYRAYKCCTAINVYYTPKQKENNLPWTSKWIGGAEVAVAPQETEQTQYIIGGIDNDLHENTFKGFKL